ncbi:MAG: DMT family transporter [Hyphomicrobiaceae bacterium]|mgnify:CR=1 FL=1
MGAAGDVPDVGARHNLTGALCVCGGAFSIGLINLIIKSLSGDYSLTQFLVVRGLAAVPVMAGLVLWEGGLGGFRVVRPGIVLLRGTIFFVATIAFGLAISQLAIADTVSVYYIMPLLIAGLAGPVLGEDVPLHRWLALVVGFAGVLVIVNPGSGILKWGALIALFGATIESFGQLTSRLMAANTSSAIGLYQTLIIFAGSLGLAVVTAGGSFEASLPASLAFLTRAWTWPTPGDLGLMILCGPITAIAVWLYVHAYKIAQASFIAPFDYTSLIWASLSGFVFFGEIPAATTWAGAAIVAAAGLFMLKQESGDDATISSTPASIDTRDHDQK